MSTILYKRNNPEIEFHDDELKHLVFKPFTNQVSLAARFEKGDSELSRLTRVEDIEVAVGSATISFEYDKKLSQVLAYCQYGEDRCLLKAYDATSFIKSVVDNSVTSNESLEQLPVIQGYMNELRKVFARVLLERHCVVISNWKVEDVFGVVKSRNYIISTFDDLTYVFQSAFADSDNQTINLDNCLLPIAFTDFEDVSLEFFIGDHKFSINIVSDTVHDFATYKSGTRHEITFSRGLCYENLNEEDIIKPKAFSSFESEEEWTADRESYLTDIDETQDTEDEFDNMLFSF